MLYCLNADLSAPSGDLAHQYEFLERREIFTKVSTLPPEILLYNPLCLIQWHLNKITSVTSYISIRSEHDAVGSWMSTVSW